MNLQIQPILSDFKKVLQQSYGNRLSRLILYGSYARGDSNSNSDIDVLVVFNDSKINRLLEIEKLSSTSSSMLSKYGFVISALPFTESKLTNEKSLLVENIKREGKEI